MNTNASKKEKRMTVSISLSKPEKKMLCQIS